MALLRVLGSTGLKREEGPGLPGLIIPTPPFPLACSILQLWAGRQGLAMPGASQVAKAGVGGSTRSIMSYQNCRAPGKAKCRASKNASLVRQGRNGVRTTGLTGWKQEREAKMRGREVTQGIQPLTKGQENTTWQLQGQVKAIPEF